MFRLQGSTSHPIDFLLVSSSDHVAGATGLSPSVSLSKDGGTFAPAQGAVSEIGFGWYKLAGNATDRNTAGVVALHATAPGADPADRDFTVVAFDVFDPNLGLAGLQGTTRPAAGPLLTAGTAANQLATDNQGNAYVRDSAGTTTLVSRVAQALSFDGSGNVKAAAITLPSPAPSGYGGSGGGGGGGGDTPGTTTLLQRIPQSLLFDSAGNVKANALALPVPAPSGYGGAGGAAGTGGDPWAVDVGLGAYSGTQAGAILLGQSMQAIAMTVAAGSQYDVTATFNDGRTLTLGDPGLARFIVLVTKSATAPLRAMPADVDMVSVLPGNKSVNFRFRTPWAAPYALAQGDQIMLVGFQGR